MIAAGDGSVGGIVQMLNLRQDDVLQTVNNCANKKANKECYHHHDCESANRIHHRLIQLTCRILFRQILQLVEDGVARWFG